MQMKLAISAEILTTSGFEAAILMVPVTKLKT